MADLGNFDAREVEPMDTFAPVPAGNYIAAIVESEMKPTKTGNGRYLELKFQVIEGEHKGRNLWARLNLDNPNELAVKIARSDLSAICRAVGVMQPKDSCELHDLPLSIKVKLRKRQDNGEMTNEIAGYAKRPAPDQASQAKSDAMPWRR
jgi:hypothetical protein